MSDEISKLPVKNKRDGEGKLFLVRHPREKCQHWHGPFVVDQDAGKCYCRECEEEVSPMFVLNRLMQQESRWMQSHERYKDEMERLSKKKRTKCSHCQKMTDIR